MIPLLVTQNQVSLSSKRKVARQQVSALVSESGRKVECRIKHCSKDYSQKAAQTGSYQVSHFLASEVYHS